MATDSVKRPRDRWGRCLSSPRWGLVDEGSVQQRRYLRYSIDVQSSQQSRSDLNSIGSWGRDWICRATSSVPAAVGRCSALLLNLWTSQRAHCLAPLRTGSTAESTLYQGLWKEASEGLLSLLTPWPRWALGRSQNIDSTSGSNSCSCSRFLAQGPLQRWTTPARGSFAGELELKKHLSQVPFCPIPPGNSLVV